MRSEIPPTTEVHPKTTDNESTMIHQFDSTNTKTKKSIATTTRKNIRSRTPLSIPLPRSIPSSRRETVETSLTKIKPDYVQRQVPNGAFEIEPDGTILHFRPYDGNGISIDELKGLNLFEDLIRFSSDRDANYFTSCIERGEYCKTTRHLLHGRDLSLILLYHGSTNTYWGFLGPA